MEEKVRIRKIESILLGIFVVLSTLLIIVPISPIVPTVVAWTNTGGGDHGGLSWTPSHLTEIAGVHTNISVFEIEAGTTVLIRLWDGSDYGNISIHAEVIFINGTLSADESGYGGGTYGTGALPSLGAT